MDLVSNLAQEQHANAWSDLDTSNNNNERSLAAGQLLRSLESALALFAGSNAVSPQPTTLWDTAQTSAAEEDEFVKVTDNVLVAIRQLYAAPQNKSIVQVAFPNEASLLGTAWMAMEQRFTLQLQVSSALQQQDAVSQGK